MSNDNQTLSCDPVTVTPGKYNLRVIKRQPRLSGHQSVLEMRLEVALVVPALIGQDGTVSEVCHSIGVWTAGKGWLLDLEEEPVRGSRPQVHTKSLKSCQQNAYIPLVLT